MKKSTNSLFFILALSLFCVSELWALDLPVEEHEFYLATNEIVDQYRDVSRYYEKNGRSGKGLAIDNINSLWGEPKRLSLNKNNLLASGFLGLGTLVFTLPNPLLAITLATGITSFSYFQSQELAVWDKGDYLIEANMRYSGNKGMISSWIWKYKGLNKAVPILGQKRTAKNDFKVGFGRGHESMFNGNSSYGNGQYVLYAHQIHSNQYARLFLETGVSWGLPGKSTPDNAHWVRIPVNLLMKTDLAASGFTFGAGGGYQFSKEYGAPSEDVQKRVGAKNVFALIEYGLTGRLSIGVKDEIQWVGVSGARDSVLSNQVSSYFGVKF